MKSRFKINYILIWALALTAADFIVAIIAFDMAFLTNDDGAIQSALAGGNAYHQFINIILSWLVSRLYRMIPGIHWWYVWSMAAVAIGIFFVHFALLKVANRSRQFLPVVIGIIAFLDVGFFIYPIANISFTIVPTIFGSGIVACLFYLAESETVKHEKLIFVGTVIGYVLLFCHRSQTGEVMLCFILLAWLYYFICRSQNWKKTVIKIIVTVAVFLAITESLTVVNRTLQNNHNGTEFSAFNSARSKFMDYPHDSYDENPELYEAVGWDKDIYTLASHWIFLEDEVTTENLNYICSNSEYTVAGSDTQIRILLKNIYHNDLCMAFLLLYAASGLLALFLVIVRFRAKSFVFLLLNNLGTWALFAYQLLNGRAIYRSLIIVFMPAVVINLILVLRQEWDRKAVRNAFHIAVIVLGVLCAVPVFTATFNNKAHNESVAAKKEEIRVYDQFLVDHSENIYVTQTLAIADNIDPLRAQVTSEKAKTIGMGGSSWKSASFYKNIESLGLTELTGDIFKRDNVYWISDTDALDKSYQETESSIFAAYYRYMKSHYGAIGFVQEDSIMDKAFVYHFVFEENADEYEGYYDLVDGYAVPVK